jgi:transcriptional regulator with XRE-family HTH domain
VQAHIDAAPYPPSERQLAKRIGVSPSALGAWRAPKSLPREKHLRAAARVVGVPYAQVLRAALQDAGYLQSEALPAESDLVETLAGTSLDEKQVEAIVRRVLGAPKRSDEGAVPQRATRRRGAQ